MQIHWNSREIMQRQRQAFLSPSPRLAYYFDPRGLQVNVVVFYDWLPSFRKVTPVGSVSQILPSLLPFGDVVLHWVLFVSMITTHLLADIFQP